MIGAIVLWVVCILWSLAAVAGTLSSDLTWQNTDLNNKIQVEKSNNATGIYTVIAQPAAGSTGYSDATNAPGDTACYRVAYFNLSGVGPYAGPVCKTFPALPSQAPASLTVK